MSRPTDHYPATCFVCDPYRLLGYYPAAEASAAINAHMHATHRKDK